MRVLVTWGSKLGGTEGIARILADALRGHGIDVAAAPADDVPPLDGFDAVIAGGALYGNRWPVNIRHFVERHVKQLRELPVWLFSSGPLDDSAAREELPPPKQVAVLAERIGAQGHVTFGGRLEPDVKSFPARSVAKTASGDWRDPERIRAWAAQIAAELPQAQPRPAIVHPARSIGRLVAHGAAGAALCAATLLLLAQLTSLAAAHIIHAATAPLFFLMIARHYFDARGARNPLPTASVWTAMVAVIELSLTALLPAQELFGSLVAIALPLALIFFTTWGTGALMWTLPWGTGSDAPASPSQDQTPRPAH